MVSRRSREGLSEVFTFPEVLAPAGELGRNHRHCSVRWKPSTSQTQWDTTGSLFVLLWGKAVAPLLAGV